MTRQGLLSRTFVELADTLVRTTSKSSSSIGWRSDALIGVAETGLC